MINLQSRCRTPRDSFILRETDASGWIGGFDHEAVSRRDDGEGPFRWAILDRTPARRSQSRGLGGRFFQACVGRPREGLAKAGVNPSGISGLSAAAGEDGQAPLGLLTGPDPSVIDLPAGGATVGGASEIRGRVDAVVLDRGVVLIRAARGDADRVARDAERREIPIVDMSLGADAPSTHGVLQHLVIPHAGVCRSMGDRNRPSRPDLKRT